MIRWRRITGGLLASLTRFLGPPPADMNMHVDVAVAVTRVQILYTSGGQSDLVSLAEDDGKQQQQCSQDVRLYLVLFGGGAQLENLLFCSSG